MSASPRCSPRRRKRCRSPTCAQNAESGPPPSTSVSACSPLPAASSRPPTAIGSPSADQRSLPSSRSRPLYSVWEWERELERLSSCPRSLPWFGPSGASFIPAAPNQRGRAQRRSRPAAAPWAPLAPTLAGRVLTAASTAARSIGSGRSRAVSTPPIKRRDCRPLKQCDRAYHAANEFLRCTGIEVRHSRRPKRSPEFQRVVFFDEIFSRFWKEGASVTGRRLSIPLLRYPIAEHLLLYGVGARPPPDGVR